MTGRRSVVWTVRDGDGATLGEVLDHARIDPGALARGAVFIGRTRVRAPDRPVRPGDEITIHDATAGPREAVILHEKDGVVAAMKPAGLSTIPDMRGDRSLLGDVAHTLSRPLDAVHPTSRLDRDVSGVVLFTLDPLARDLLLEARRAGRYARRYVAISGAAPRSPSGIWAAPIGRHANKLLRAVNGKDAVPAQTRWAVVEQVQHACIMALDPVTGRTHQLRVHASHANAPLLGDRAYGGARRIVLPSGEVLALDRIFLHAARVRVTGPLELEVHAEIPMEFEALRSALHASPGVWDRALSCETGSREESPP